MVQKQSGGERSEQSFPINLMPPDLAEAANRRIEGFIDTQSDLLGALQETSRQRSDRMQNGKQMLLRTLLPN